MNEHDNPQCTVCGEFHGGGTCEAMRAAAAQGAQPPGVPLRIYGGYLEARSAMRASAPEAAVRVLQWLLGYLAEERGAKAAQSLTAKVDSLCEAGVISERMRASVGDEVFEPSKSEHAAWALMSLVEHALARLYLPTAPVHAQ